jgi:hypothetical protein
VAEGAPLLREYRVKSLIEGSNPSLSARYAEGPARGLLRIWRRERDSVRTLRVDFGYPGLRRSGHRSRCDRCSPQHPTSAVTNSSGTKLDSGSGPEGAQRRRGEPHGWGEQSLSTPTAQPCPRICGLYCFRSRLVHAIVHSCGRCCGRTHVLMIVDAMKRGPHNWKFSAPVAQLDRVPGYELGGREFESLRARHYPGERVLRHPFSSAPTNDPPAWAPQARRERRAVADRGV